MDTASLRMLISTDPPDHTRIRRLLSRAFTPKAVTELEPRLRVICDELVETMVANAAAGEADLVRDLAIPFPVIVIAELLGVPAQRRADFRHWSDALSGALSGDWDPADAQVAGLELVTFMAEEVERRRVDPGNDLISRLVAGSSAEDPEGLTAEEITVIAILLLVAGNETTTNLIGNVAGALAAHPEQANRLWVAPDLLPAAIEEVLRWDSPVQGILRGTTRETSLAGVELPAGATVLVCFAAANRDPSHFDQPDLFDIGRRSNDHFAFGNGIHFCLGASLARLEARLAFESIRNAGMRLAPSEGMVRGGSGFMLRGFSRFPLTEFPLTDARAALA
jgi:cytochrome P450